MPHIISFVRSYKSITSLNEIELPDITVITGANGSGKSHLLQAIASGRVSTTATAEHRTKVSLFDWNSIVPADNEAYSIAARSAKIDELMTRFSNARNSVLSTIQQNVENTGLDRNIVNNLDDLQALCDPNYTQYFPREPELSTARNVQAWMPGLWQHFSNSVTSENMGMRGKVKEAWAQDYKLLMFGNSKDIRERLIIVEELSLNSFSQAFAKIFVDYMHKWQTNYLARSTDGPFLSDAEFIAENQMPPWEFVNDILEEGRLPFRINSPSKSNFLESFEPKLIRTDSAAEMRFSDLSSGEKVLMSFALCVYNVTGKNVVFPELLLLDEVDAPLHPEMVEVMLRVLQNVIVNEHKIKVMLTTHKPTTVALAPEGSIYQMIQSGPQLVPISREKGVSVLTVGVPTMAFTTDMRLQVFTEASVDAAVYGKMYQIFKAKLSGNRSIEFIQSGRKVAAGDLDAGRSRVNDLVSRLRASGASTILGVVDWDGKDNDVKWVHELCKGKRYSVENLFLDPVIVIALLAKDFIVFAKKIGVLQETEYYVDVLKWDTHRWQLAVDSLEGIIFEQPEEKKEVKYVNNMILGVSNSFLMMRGHDLVQLISKKLSGSLEKYPGDKLLSHISESVIPDIKDFVPLDIIDLLNSIVKVAESDNE